MRTSSSVRSFESHEWRTYRELRLRALAESPNAFGTTVAEAQQRTDADWASQLSSGVESSSDLPLVAEVGGAMVGMAWGKLDAVEPSAAHLFQMWVRPESRGLGAGSTLLAAVVAWLRSLNAASLGLRVTCDNAPARRLYERAGFLRRGRPEPLRPGSPVLVQTMHLDLGEPPPNREL